jgi:hypothetical protein
LLNPPFNSKDFPLQDATKYLSHHGSSEPPPLLEAWVLLILPSALVPFSHSEETSHWSVRVRVSVWVYNDLVSSATEYDPEN